jgi:hypothetical protein
MAEMLTAAQEARVIGVHRSSVHGARNDKTHPVHLPGADVIEMGDPKNPRLHPRAPRPAVEAWWAKRWADASPGDLTRKRRRPAPAKASVEERQEEPRA